MVVSLTLPFFITTAHSAEVTLTWDPNAEPDIAGYRIYYGFESGVYEYVIDVGNRTTVTFSEVNPDVSYYVAITAYNWSGLESDFSSEIVYRTTAPLQPPVSDAGLDQNVYEGVTVTLNGGNSTDPDGGIIAYLWEQAGGSPVEISDPSGAVTTFTAPDVGPEGFSLTFQMTVTDENGLTASDSCVVNVYRVNLPRP